MLGPKKRERKKTSKNGGMLSAKNTKRGILLIYISINYARWQYGGDKVAMKTIKRKRC